MDHALSYSAENSYCIEKLQTLVFVNILSLNDLRDTFACVKLKVSLLMILFRETVVAPPTVDMAIFSCQ